MRRRFTALSEDARLAAGEQQRGGHTLLRCVNEREYAWHNSYSAQLFFKLSAITGHRRVGQPLPARIFWLTAASVGAWHMLLPAFTLRMRVATPLSARPRPARAHPRAAARIVKFIFIFMAWLCFNAARSQCVSLRFICRIQHF